MKRNKTLTYYINFLLLLCVFFFFSFFVGRDRFIVMIQVLVTLAPDNVLEKHGVYRWAFLAAIGGYRVAHEIDFRIHQTNPSISDDPNFPDHQENSSRISSFVVVFKSLSIVSLVSTLVPLPEVIGYIILSMSCISAVVFIVVAYEVGKLYKEACRWIYKKIMESALTRIRNNNWFHEASNNNMIISNPSTEQPPPALSDIV